jgi:hypothetical protein
MKTLIIAFTLTLLSSYHAHSQTKEYEYSCDKDKATIYWNESRKGNLIYLKTIQGSEINKYVLTSDYHTVLWEYSNQDKGTNIKVVLKNGIYKINGMLKSKSYSKTYKSNGVPWFQNIGFNIGYSIKKKPTFRFECIRPDNLKLYEMQADGKEVIARNGIREQRINVHLTGILSKFFGCDYYVDLSSGQFIQYKGVQGAPGTPETIVTIKK